MLVVNGYNRFRMLLPGYVKSRYFSGRRRASATTRNKARRCRVLTDVEIKRKFIRFVCIQRIGPLPQMTSGIYFELHLGRRLNCTKHRWNKCFNMVSFDRVFNVERCIGFWIVGDIWQLKTTSAVGLQGDPKSNMYVGIHNWLQHWKNVFY